MLPVLNLLMSSKDHSSTSPDGRLQRPCLPSLGDHKPKTVIAPLDTRPLWSPTRLVQLEKAPLQSSKDMLYAYEVVYIRRMSLCTRGRSEEWIVRWSQICSSMAGCCVIHRCTMSYVRYRTYNIGGVMNAPA